jgi:imidazolonepropionase-like amidohydrolase
MFASAAFAQTAPQRTIVLNADRMITISSPTLVRNARVVVTGDRITAVGTAANVQVPAGAQVIDLGDVTLLPGFIDAHTHIAGRTLGDPHGDVASVKDYQGYAAILGVENAQRTLMGGFT